MIRKRSFLVVGVLLILFILIANAAEERVNESLINETQNLGYLNYTLNEELNVNINNTKNVVEDTKNNEVNSIIDNNTSNKIIESSNNEKNKKSATASFGVYLQVIG